MWTKAKGGRWLVLCVGLVGQDDRDLSAWEEGQEAQLDQPFRSVCENSSVQVSCQEGSRCLFYHLD